MLGAEITEFITGQQVVMARCKMHGTGLVANVNAAPGAPADLFCGIGANGLETAFFVSLRLGLRPDPNV